MKKSCRIYKKLDLPPCLDSRHRQPGPPWTWVSSVEMSFHLNWVLSSLHIWGSSQGPRLPVIAIIVFTVLLELYHPRVWGDRNFLLKNHEMTRRQDNDACINLVLMLKNPHPLKEKFLLSLGQCNTIWRRDDKTMQHYNTIRCMNKFCFNLEKSPPPQ